MANLSITSLCNKACAYCFASDTKRDFGKSFMNERTFERALDYLALSDFKQVRLLGGEPTLHPFFIRFAKYALSRDFNLMVFTNGLMPTNVLDFLTTIPQGRLALLLNTIHPAENNPRGITKQKIVMSKLAPSIIPGLTIFSTIVDLEHILDYYSEFDLKKEIRLGLAHLVLSGTNRFLHPKHYAVVGRTLYKFKNRLDSMGISMGFDCGFVPCMFPPEAMIGMAKELVKTGTCCHPLIDMLPDGSFISCYPLHDLKQVPLSEELGASQLITYFENELKPYIGTGIYTHCRSCTLFNTKCNGGCFSYRIRRYHT